MTRLRGRSPCGERLKASAPFGKWGTQTFIAGLRRWGSQLLDGPINRAVFDTYIETQLAPTLQRGDVVILDNLAAHRSAAAAECLKAKGAWFLFLPPLQSGPEPNRDGLLETQSPSARQS